MILSFSHKGLKLFFDTGNKKGIIAEHSGRLARILDRLDASLKPEDMNLPGFKLHKLTGDKKEFWAVSVSGNWRIIFQFAGENAINVDYINYH
jgi:toxin HigB-1